ncbi:MAG: PfkB family carbohydrate kinase, partial [Bacilli bacterium]
MIDLCFAGNSSIDFINNEIYCLGGSAIYSSLSARTSTKKNISVISNVNDEIFNVLKNRKINLIGNVVEDITQFNIDEINGTCQGANYNSEDILINEKLNINHLHISFRKGVNIENILDNKLISYKTLSIDVMIHSVNEYIKYIQKYKNKINIIFCNSTEFNIIKEYIDDIPIKVITNEDKPIIVLNQNTNLSFNANFVNSPTSTTGAGDSFIGGVLTGYIENDNLNDMINRGIYNSSESIKNFGPLINKKSVIKLQNVNKLPENIIVIGNSCAGKTTFIDFLKNYYGFYEDIDDLEPLLEMFLIDDISYEKNIEKFKMLKSKITFMNDIFELYLNDFENIDHYTKIASDNNGHDIIKPILWDMILQKSISKYKKQNNIIQFSRGNDKDYEFEFGNNVYERSLKVIKNELPNFENSIIINLKSDINIRKERNINRYKNGGHFVSEKTMEEVYGKDIFKYEILDDNKGYIIIDNIKIPVYTINNNK